jgi:hypothetical protein
MTEQEQKQEPGLPEGFEYNERLTGEEWEAEKKRRRESAQPRSQVRPPSPRYIPA